VFEGFALAELRPQALRGIKATGKALVSRNISAGESRFAHIPKFALVYLLVFYYALAWFTTL
jgi:hypothetical protein